MIQCKILLGTARNLLKKVSVLIFISYQSCYYYCFIIFFFFYDFSNYLMADDLDRRDKLILFKHSSRRFVTPARSFRRPWNTYLYYTRAPSTVLCVYKHLYIYIFVFFPRFLANRRRWVLSRTPTVPKFQSKNKIWPAGVQNISRLPVPPHPSTTTRLKLTVIEKHESGKLLSSPRSLVAYSAIPACTAASVL